MEHEGGDSRTRPRKPSRGQLSYAFGFLAVVSVAAVAIMANEILESPPRSDATEWTTLALSVLVGGFSGYFAVRLRKPSRDKGRRAGSIWWVLVIPVAGSVTLFNQFAPLMVRIPVFGLLGGAGLGMWMPLWKLATRGLPTRDE
jgi:hypothetical protein